MDRGDVSHLLIKQQHNSRVRTIDTFMNLNIDPDDIIYHVIDTL